MTRTVGGIAQQERYSLKSRFENLHRSYWPSIETLIVETILSVCQTDSLLYQMTVYQMRTGGKRLRAILPLLVAEALENDPKRILAFSAACETLHNASVVHDDLQDGDTVRRGLPTIWKRFGLPQAVNLGDALIACAFSLVQHVDVPPILRERVTRHMLLQMLHAANGQVRDLELRADPPTTIQDYMRIVEAKTAAFFVLPISGAGMLCGAG